MRVWRSYTQVRAFQFRDRLEAARLDDDDDDGVAEVVQASGGAEDQLGVDRRRSARALPPV
jgi:hypothetical protein